MAKIDFLILASLKDGEKNGKEIMNELNKEFGFFWQAKTSMIYPALRKLQKHGLIRENEEKSNESISYSKYYELTKKGIEDLESYNKPRNSKIPFFRGSTFKPPSSPFKKFHYWEKFVDAKSITDNIKSYRKHLVKELVRLDKKIEVLKEKEEYKKELKDLDID